MAVTNWTIRAVLGSANTTLGSFGAFSPGPSVASLPNGGYAVAWTQGATGATTIAYQFFDVQGIPTTSVLTIPAESGSVYMPQISASGANVAISYTRDGLNSGDEDVRLRLFDAAGVSLGGAVNLGFTNLVERDSAIAGTATGTVIAYDTNQNIVLTIRDSLGAAVVPTVTVASGPDQEIDPTVAVLAGGNIVVAWLDVSSANYLFKVYNAAGAALATPADFRLASATVSGAAYKPDLAALANGNFVAVWSDTTARPSDGSSYHIGTQIFSATGAKIGAEHVANITFNGPQDRASVAPLADGGFLVTWSDGSNGGGPAYDVIGARFDAAGAAVGGEFTVVQAAGRQFDPAMTLLGDGRVLVAYLDDAAATVVTQILDPRDGLVTGTAASEALTGSNFNDTISGLGGDDQVYAGIGDDLVSGGTGNDVLNGGSGNDTLDGGTGNDTLIGGSSDDVYAVDSAGDVVTELVGQGIDTVYSSVQGYVLAANVEIGRLYGAATSMTGNALDNILAANGGASSLSGAAGDDTLYGSTFADTLDGGDGNDIFRGGGGGDTMIGGTGDDQFVVQNVNIVIVENAGEGLDTAYVAVNLYQLGPNIEIARLSAPGAVILYGSVTSEDLVANQAEASQLYGQGGNDVLWGSQFGDVMDGGTGDDIMRGQGGADTMYGGVGNDQFVVFDVNAQIFEFSGEGYDIVYYTGPAGGPGFFIGANVEEARLVGTATGLLGNDVSNLLVGNSSGLASVIDGGGGDDIIYGTAAADTLTGGDGNDTFYSQGGADRFVYTQRGWGYDQIGGWAAGQAKIDFSLLGLTFGQLSIVSANGNSQVQYGADAILIFGLPTLTAADFLF